MISNLKQLRHSGTERAWSCVLLALTLILCISFSAAAGGFTYEHDPLDNPHAAADIVRDDEAVYGYRPSTTGSLAVYADEDWFDAEKVEGWRQERIAYHESIEAMYTLLEEMSAAGNTAIIRLQSWTSRWFSPAKTPTSRKSSRSSLRSCS